MPMKNSILTKSISYKDFKKEILNDYRNIVISREASLLGRKEVLSGKAKFGIFGDGKELPQIAMAKVFDKGDFRSGYYRDQTFMFAINKLTVKQFFLDYMQIQSKLIANFVTKTLQMVMGIYTKKFGP